MNKNEVTSNSGNINERLKDECAPSPIEVDLTEEDMKMIEDELYEGVEVIEGDHISRNKYKSKIDYWDEVNKPVIAIFFSYFNVLSHKRINENTPTVDGVTLRGILDRSNVYIDNVPDFPPTTFDYTVLLSIRGNELAVYLNAFKEGDKIRTIIRVTSADIDDVKSVALYKEIFKLALDASNLKGSYMTILDNQLEWEVRELKELSFDDVFLPPTLMDDLSTYTKLFETRKILQRYMFSGIPGTGKTESTRAISKILNDKGVTIIKTNICQIIKQKFELASILAPSIVILDDIDLYLGDRNKSGVSNLLGQFLDILDGVDKLPADVGVIASTNAPHLIDLAAQRPGRFNKLLFFDELTKDNIKNIILKSLTSFSNQFEAVTDDDIKKLSSVKMVNFFFTSKSTGASIYEAIKNIKHKQDILGGKIDLEGVIKELRANYEMLDKKLRESVIKNKFGGTQGDGIGFKN